MIHYLLNINDIIDLSRPFYFQVYITESVTEGIINWSQNQEASFRLINKMGHLEVSTAPGGLLALNNFLYLLMSVLFLISIKFTLQILDDIKVGAFLLVENTTRFRWIVLLNLLAFIFSRLPSTITSYYFNKKIISDEGLELGMNMFSLQGIGLIVFWCLFLILIAEVFRIGAMVKRENDLTI